MFLRDLVLFIQLHHSALQVSAFEAEFQLIVIICCFILFLYFILFLLWSH